LALKSKSRSTFQYKPRTVDQIKGRANRKTSMFDSIFKPGFDTYRPKTGDNLFRYLPPTWDDSEHYGYTAFVHRNIGANNSTYLCPRKMLNKPCPICEAQKEAKDAGESEEATALGTSERVICWVLDRDADDPEKPMIYDTSWTQDRDIVSLCVNERTGEILMIDHPDKGYDVTIKRSGTGLKTKYYGYAIARDASPIHDSEKAQDEILDYIKENPIPDTFNFYDYDYLQGVLSGTVAEKDTAIDKDETDEVPFEKPTRRGPRRDQELDPENEEEEIKHPRTATKKTRVVEEVEEEEEEVQPRRSSRRVVEEEPEEEVVQPRRSSRRPEPVDEEVDEEAEEVAPRRTASRTQTNARSRVVEEVEDEEEAPPARRSSTRVR
jgi:gp32 DNA binding protein like